MIRRRHLFLTAFILIAVFFTVVTTYFSSPEVQSKLRHALEVELSSQMGGTVTIGRVRLGILSMTAEQVIVHLPKSALDLSIEKIRVGFSLGALLKRHWSPEELIDETTLIAPRLSISLSNKSQDTTLQHKTASEISAAILQALPLRKVAIKKCDITITSGKRTLATFEGLNGTLQRQKSNLALSLKGTMGKRHENISLSGVLSKNIEEQYFSLRCTEVPLISPLLSGNGSLSGQFFSTLEIFFQDIPYPNALLLDGKMTIKEIRMEERGIPIITDGTIALRAKEGHFSNEQCFLLFKERNTRVNAHFSLSLQEGGEALLSLHNNKSDKLRAQLSLSPTSDTVATASLQGTYTTLGGQLTLVGKAHTLRDGWRHVIDSLNLTSPFGMASVKGSYSTALGYNLSSKLSLSHALTPKLKAQGTGNITITGKNENYDLRGVLDSLMVYSATDTIRLPNARLSTESKTLRVQAADSLYKISAYLRMQEFSADIMVHPAGVKKMGTTFGFASFVEKGACTFSLSGTPDNILFTTNMSGTTPIGTFSLFGSGAKNKQGINAAVDVGTWKWKGVTIPFSASLKEKNDRWKFQFADNRNTLIFKSAIKKETQSIESGTILLNSFPATWLNLLFPDDQIPITDGTLSGSVLLSGKLNAPSLKGDLSLRDGAFGKEEGLRTTMRFQYSKKGFSAQPFVVTTPTDTLLNLTTFVWGKEQLLKGSFDNLRLDKLTNYVGGPLIKGTLSGSFSTKNDVTYINASTPLLGNKEIEAKTVTAKLRLTPKNLIVDSCQFKLYASKSEFNGVIPLTGTKEDSLTFNLLMQGDLIATIDSLPNHPLGGSGFGTIQLSGGIYKGELFYSKARLLVPHGTLKIFPFTRDRHIENFQADINIFHNDSTAVRLEGEVDRRTVVIKNSYATSDTITPFMIGQLNLGVFQIFTDEGGIPIFIPGFMENRPSNVGFIEPLGMEGIKAFTVSGPSESPKLSGTLLIRKTEITFPLLHDVVYPKKSGPPTTPFSHILQYNLDVRAADRTVTYFYQLGLKKSRRATRIIECTIDPSMSIGVRGNLEEETFRVVGGLRSYKGSLFYGTWFDQNFELGLDFAPTPMASGGYDNMPIIWGSAETYSDSTRINKIGVKIFTKDPKTGMLRQRGRFTEVVVAPTSEAQFGASTSSGSNATESFTSALDATDMVAKMGDNYLSNYVFNYWGRQLARKIGLDMIRIESSMMNNSMTALMTRSETSTNNWEQIALQNTGITVGKYLFGSDVFLKWRTEFGAQDSLLVPVHKIGLEYQPIPYLWMDFNYGLSRDAYTEQMIVNPEVRLQLRIPLSHKSSSSTPEDSSEN